jgi:putative transposase
MARPLRPEFEGAVYHVMSHGREKGRIFSDDADRALFLDGLKHVVEEKRWIVHAYCLTANHVHLLVETPVGNLSAGMHAVNGAYSQAYNRRHSRTGQLMEGRFHAVLVQKESYLLELACSIVLNPVRARTVKDPADYPWSNYRATAGDVPAPSWLDTEWTLAQFGKNRRSARNAYRRFVLEGKGLPSPLEQVTRQVYLGDEEFLKDVESRVQGRTPRRSAPLARQRVRFVPIARIKKAVAASFGVDEHALKRSRGGADKVAAIYLSRRLSGLSGAEIGAAFDVTPARISQVMNQVRAGKWPQIEDAIRKLEKQLSPSMSR